MAIYGESGSCLTRGFRRKSRPWNRVPSSASTTLGASTLSPVSSPCTECSSYPGGLTQPSSPLTMLCTRVRFDD